MTKAEMLKANCIFLTLGDPTFVGQTVTALKETGVQLVMLHDQVWRNAALHDAIKAAGLTIWYHMLPPGGGLWPDSMWLARTAVTLERYKARAIYADGSELWGLNPGETLNHHKILAYREVCRHVIGPDGMLGGSSWGWEWKLMDVANTWDVADLGAEPRQMVDAAIKRGLELKPIRPDMRVEAGWVGMCNFVPTYHQIPWTCDNIRYAWDRCKMEGLPITWQTTASWLVERQDLRMSIAAGERR